MSEDLKSIGVGALCGLTSVALLFSGVIADGIAPLLIFVTPLPVLIATAGWGIRSGLACLAVVLAGLSFSSNLGGAIAIIGLFIAPAFVVAILASLAQPADDGTLIWFPVSQILFWLAMVISGVVISVGIAIGYGPELIKEMVEQFREQLAKQMPELADNPQFNPNQLQASLASLLPIAPGLYLVMVHVANLYLGLNLLRASARLNRPKPDWPSALVMPWNALPIFGIALAVSLFISGSLVYAAMVICGAFGGGFMICGYALVHNRTRGQSWRLPAIICLYASTILLSIPMALVTFAAVIHTSISGRSTALQTPDRKD